MWLSVNSLLCSYGTLLGDDALHPFNHYQQQPRARAFTPNEMEPEEIKAFPDFVKYVKFMGIHMGLCMWCVFTFSHLCVDTAPILLNIHPPW